MPEFSGHRERPSLTVRESPLLSEVRRSRVGRNVILISPGNLFPILFLCTEGTGLCEVGWPGVPCLDRMMQNIWTRTSSQHLEFGRIFLLYEVCCQEWSNLNESSRLHGAYPATLVYWSCHECEVRTFHCIAVLSFSR